MTRSLTCPMGWGSVTKSFRLGSALAGPAPMLRRGLAEVLNTALQSPPAPATSRSPNDLYLLDKVQDVVGLYLGLPDHAVVLCVAEKPPIQALEQTQLVLHSING